MELLPIKEIKINQTKINKIGHLVKSIYRLIIYSRHHSPQKWNEHTEAFFEQEIDRLLANATLLYETVNKIGQERENAIK